MPRKKKKKTEETPKLDASKSAIVRKLIKAGKDKGYLSYDDVNDVLPDTVVSSEEIDEVITVLDSENIKVVDSERYLSPSKGTRKR